MSGGTHERAGFDTMTNKEPTDVRALRDLADWWRRTEAAIRREHGNVAGAPLPDDAPGLRITAIQLEWAAREIEALRGVSTGTEDET